MRKPKRLEILFLLVFAVLAPASAAAMFLVNQIPTEETVTVTLYTYASNATYDYVAVLKPNTIYDNKTYLKPNEGTLYTKITSRIRVTLSYGLQATGPTQATITVTYQINRTLKTEAFSYQISATKTTETNQTQIQITLPLINCTELEALKSSIESEIGATSASLYYLEIAPTFVVDAQISGFSAEQTFSPTLLVAFENTSQGEVISFNNMSYSQPGAITRDEKRTRSDIVNQLFATYILTPISFIGLVASAIFYRTRSRAKETSFDELVAPYKDMVIETQTVLTIPPETVLIEVNTVKELARIAGILAKPILHSRDSKEHVLFILDNGTKYQCKILSNT